MKNPDRMCCADDECYRNDVIYKLEEEFDIEVSPYMQWGGHDMFVYIEDKLYYYKPKIQEVVNMVIEEVNDERDIIDQIGMLLQQDMYKSIDIIQCMKEGVAGMPPFIEETESFIVLENLNGTELPVSEWKNNSLTIRDNFTDDINPLKGYLNEHALYKIGDKIYCNDVAAFEYNPKLNFGVFTEINGNTIFNAFETLTEDQDKVVELYKEGL